MAQSHILVGATTSAQPIVRRIDTDQLKSALRAGWNDFTAMPSHADRKSTRLNSSHKHRYRMPSSA